jgi:hypothetical protein
MILVRVLEANTPKKCIAGTNVVLLDADVARVFKTSVNQALRSLAEIIKAQKQKA